MIVGKLKGAGRKPSPPELLKVPVSIKLPLWLIEWMNAKPVSRAVLIETAIRKQEKCKPPEGA